MRRPQDLPEASPDLIAYLRPAEEPRPRQAPPVAPGRRTKYVVAAITSEHDALARTISGRHHASLRAAQRLGTLVGAGLLDYGDAFDVLVAACERNGYVRRVGRSAVERTIRDGLTWGAAHPREVAP